MLNITDEAKAFFYLQGYIKQYEITFHDIELVISNEQIHSESPVIKESICEEEDFTLGGCIASSMEYTVSEILADQISGLEFTAKIKLSDEDGNVVLTLPMGVYRVDSAKRENDKDYKKITAYDRLYDASADVSDWYNDLFPVLGTETVPSGEQDEDGSEIMVQKNIYGTTTAKEMRESLLRHMGIPFVVQELPNDSMTVEKTIEPGTGSLPGTTVLKAITTVNGGFGRMNREGKFEVIHLTNLGVFPEDSKGAAVPPEQGGNLYPSETLYPEDSYTYLGVSDEENECPEYRTVTYEEYMTHPITCLNIQTDEEDAGVTIGEDTTNPYIITANFLLYGKSSVELETVGGNIFRWIEGITYRPNTTELNGLPYLEVGDVYALEKRDDLVESYIFSRTLSGIQALKDVYEAKGNKIRANEVSPAQEIQQLKGKMLKITKECDKFAVSLVDLEKNAESLLEMSATNILLQVTKEGKVAAMTLDASGKETNFSIEADNINFNGKTFDLTSDRINIQSDNFSVSNSGEVTARAIEITGGKFNIDTAVNGESAIRFRNAKYEGAYRGIVRFLGYGPPKQTSNLKKAKKDDVYYDKQNSETYAYAGGRNPWIKIVVPHMEIPPDMLIRFYGSGEPEGTPDEMDARPEEFYVNLEDGKLYQCYVDAHDDTMKWAETTLSIITEIDEWTENFINTENGFCATKYHYVADDDNQLIKCHNTSSLAADGISLSLTEIDGKGRLQELKSAIKLTSNGKNSEDEDGVTFAPRIEYDSEVYAPRMSCENMQSGYIYRQMNANTIYQVNVSLDMPAVPSVVATPVTSNPSAVSVSVANISESGFTIYMRRTDGNYPLRVDWIAMC